MTLNELPKIDGSASRTEQLSDRLNMARMEVSATKGLSIHKNRIDSCINNKGMLILFTHTFQSQFLTGGGYENFQEIITYLKDKNVEFLTVNDAVAKIEGTLNQKLSDITTDITKIKEKLGL